MAGRKSDFTLPKFDDIFSTQEMRDDEKLAKIRDIPLELIDDFPDHPYKVRDDEDMMQLAESIKERGVITPATVRQKEDGTYRLYVYDRICGKRRSADRYQQSVRFHFRTHPCNRAYPARLRYCSGRSFPEIPRSFAESQRLPYPCRRCHHHLCKGNPHSHYRLSKETLKRGISVNRICPKLVKEVRQFE